jgi:hypothetical protein
MEFVFYLFVKNIKEIKQNFYIYPLSVMICGAEGVM